MKKLIAVHAVRVFVGRQRCDIAPGNPLPADVDPDAIAELLTLGAVKEEDDDEAVADQGAGDLVPVNGGDDTANTITGDGSGEPLPEVLAIDEFSDPLYAAATAALGSTEAPAPTPEPEGTPTPAPAAKSASKKVKADQA